MRRGRPLELIGIIPFRNDLVAAGPVPPGISFMPSSGLLAPSPLCTLVCLTRSLEAVMMAQHFRGIALAVLCLLGFQAHAQTAELEATRPLRARPSGHAPESPASTERQEQFLENVAPS